MKSGMLFLIMLCSTFGIAQSIVLPPEFEDVSLIDGLKDPSSLAFSPDGRMWNQPSNAVGGDRPFDGFIDEMRIYGITLTQNQIDSIRLAPVDKCINTVANLNDDGNGSFRRVVDCAQSGDTLTFDVLPDSIKITSLPIDVNNGMTIIGQPTYQPLIYNTLGEPGLDININVNVNLDKLDFRSKNGPFLFNAGVLNIESVHMTIPQAAMLPYIQNTGQAIINGEIIVVRE